jgi:DUF1680 family protein
VQSVHGNPQIAAARGRVAFERGPIVYCFEQLDAKAPLAGLAVVPPTAQISTAFRPDLLGGVQTLTVEAHTAGLGNGPSLSVQAIPYFAWNNRGLGPMTVWLARAAR